MTVFRIFLVTLFAGFAAAPAMSQVQLPQTEAVLARPASGLRLASGEAFVSPTFKDLLQTFIMLDGADLKDNKKADDYARLMYCNLYKEKYSSDFEWNTIRTQISDRVKYKKESYRTLYEIGGVIYLGRYNFETQDFPLINSSALFNISSLVMTSPAPNTETCASMYQGSFPSGFNIKLKQPLTLDRLKVPLDEAEKLLAKMEKVKNTDRRLYVRFRVRLTGVAEGASNLKVGVFVGDVVGIDVFYDSDRTRLFSRVPIE